MAIFGVVLLKIALVFLFIVINAIIIQFVSSKMGLEEAGFDNSTSIALVIGIIFFVVSFLPILKVPFSVLGCTVLPIILIKEFYKVEWKRTIKLWAEWAGLYVALIAVFALIFALFM